MSFKLRKILLLIVISINLFFFYSSAMSCMRRKATEFSAKIMNYEKECSIRVMKRKEKRFIIEADRVSAKIAEVAVATLGRFGYYARNVGYSTFSFIRGTCNYYFRENPNELKNIFNGKGIFQIIKGIMRFTGIKSYMDEDINNREWDDITNQIGEVLSSFEQKSWLGTVTGFCGTILGFGCSMFNHGLSVLRFGNSAAHLASGLLLAAGIYSRWYQNDLRGTHHAVTGTVGLIVTHFVGKIIKKRN